MTTRTSYIHPGTGLTFEPTVFRYVKAWDEDIKEILTTEKENTYETTFHKNRVVVIIKNSRITGWFYFSRGITVPGNRMGNCVSSEGYVRAKYKSRQLSFISPYTDKNCWFEFKNNDAPPWHYQVEGQPIIDYSSAPKKIVPLPPFRKRLSFISRETMLFLAAVIFSLGSLLMFNLTYTSVLSSVNNYYISGGLGAAALLSYGLWFAFSIKKV